MTRVETPPEPSVATQWDLLKAFSAAGCLVTQIGEPIIAVVGSPPKRAVT